MEDVWRKGKNNVNESRRGLGLQEKKCASHPASPTM